MQNRSMAVSRHDCTERLAPRGTIGDAVLPRTVEEAVLDGFKAAWNL